MKLSSLVGHVLELFDLIERRKEPADAVAKEFFRERRYLGAKDRRFIADTVFDMLRHHHKIHFFAEEASRQLHLPSLSPIALYIAYATRIRNEERADVLSAVESSWRFAFPRTKCEQFFRAVEAVRIPATIQDDPVRRLALEYSFPEFILSEWMTRFGEEETARLCAALNQQAPVVVRVNTLKATREECRARLVREGVECEPTTLSPFGLVLKKRINAQALSSFKDGWFEMQDEGSQLLSLMLEPKPGHTVVDACAGGGGKTLHIAALMNNKGCLYASDVDEMRLRNVLPRLTRAGVTVATLLHAEKDKERLAALVGTADSVLVDAPCSGIGTFRRNPGAKLTVTEAYVERMARTQQSILETYAPLVRSGGRLVYSTCTLVRKENEEIVENFLQRHPEFALVDAPALLRNYGVEADFSSHYLLLLPHRTQTDGFFAATMVRRSS
jgi:16S rRNA (cytosine967-C5)-methyltransferase